MLVAYPARTMPFTDLPLDELRRYDPGHPAPEEFDEFWRTTLEEARARPIAASFVPVDTGLRAFDTFDVTFAGFGGQSGPGWLHLPAGVDEPLPAVVEYVGYGGGRGLPHERAAVGRGRLRPLRDGHPRPGLGVVGGDTPDPGRRRRPPSRLHDPRHPRPASYYYRRVFIDAVRAVEAARAHPLVDPARGRVTGGSQGGGIAIAAAGAGPGRGGRRCRTCRSSATSRGRRRSPTATRTPRSPATCKAHRDHVDRALRHAVLLRRRVVGRARPTAPALFSVGADGPISPPSTVYAAFNAYGGPKEIVEYPFNDHEGGGAFHEVAKLRWIADTLAAVG